MSDGLLITLILIISLRYVLLKLKYRKQKKVLLLTELLRLNKYELIYAFFTLTAFKPLRPS
jgi:hypothetical protein